MANLIQCDECLKTIKDNEFQGTWLKLSALNEYHSHPNGLSGDRTFCSWVCLRGHAERKHEDIVETLLPYPVK